MDALEGSRAVTHVGFVSNSKHHKMEARVMHAFGLEEVSFRTLISRRRDPPRDLGSSTITWAVTRVTFLASRMFVVHPEASIVDDRNWTGSLDQVRRVI